MVDDIYRQLKLYCDNNLAVQYAHNNKSSGAAKHIDIKYYVVKDNVRDHVISLGSCLEHISTEKDDRGSVYKRLTTQRVDNMGLREKPKIPGQKKAQR